MHVICNSSKNHITDYILEETDMPDELIRGVQGVQVFQQVLPQVSQLKIILVLLLE